MRAEGPSVCSPRSIVGEAGPLPKARRAALAADEPGRPPWIAAALDRLASAAAGR
ncbi:hypothetical protein [Cryptosporangium japonicum]|uniref:hypothetical protein n=1 Tax=Cryptosporangium japonicum TaxID=80872 RepID=UPI0031D06801